MAAVFMRLHAMPWLVVLGSVAPAPNQRLGLLQIKQNSARGPIQTLPKTDEEEHQKNVDKLIKKTKKQTVRHDEKLENKILHLKMQVKELGSTLEKEEKEEAMAEARSNARIKLGLHRHEANQTQEVDEAEEKVEREIGKASAFMIFGSVILSAYLFFLANNGDLQVALWFWHTAESVVIIFLAVLWFHAFDDILESAGFGSHYQVWAALLHLLFLFAVVVGLIWTVKDRHRLLTAYTGIGAHYVAFAAVHWGVATQEAYFSWSPLITLLSVLLFFVIVVGCSLGLHLFKTRLFNESASEAQRLHHQDFEDGVDEVENIVGAGLLAIVWTMAVRYAMMGRPPALQSDTDHNMLQRGLFFGYALVMTAIAAFLLPKLEDWLREEAHAASYLQTRLMLLASPFLTFSVAWAYLLWAELEFYEIQFSENKALGCLIFAVLVTLICFTVVFAFAKYSKRERHPDLDRADNDKMRDLAVIEEQLHQEREAELRKTVVNMVALLIGFSWAATINITLSDSFGRAGHPGLLTAGVAIGGAALILPLYVLYLRPYVENLEQEMWLHS